MKYRFLTISIIFIFAFNFVLFTYADVKYIGDDKKTKGDWPGKYGKNGAVAFKPGGDSKDLKDIVDIKDNGQRWDWANPTQDQRGLVYPDDPKKRLGSCMFNNPVGIVTIETKLTNYQVAVYAVDWDSSVRVQDLVGYQGAKAPAQADVTVSNPDFHEGVYYIWSVTGKEPFNLQITHKGGANWVISGIFIDAIKAAVDPGRKLTLTWGNIKTN